MSISSPSSDPFLITADQKVRYESQFVRICSSRSDLLSGDQAKNVMLASGLPPNVLAHIWFLSDIDSDGKMDINEFSIALHLISLKLKGFELPKTLPQSLRILVEPPSFAAFSDMSSFGTTTTGPPTRPPIPTSYSNPSVEQMMSSSAQLPMSADMSKKVQRSGSLTSGDYPNSMLLTEWAIPQKLKYTQQFNSHDRTRTGFLTGPQARNILMESRLPQSVLAQIWNLSDIDSDGRLTCDEFVVAMHLVDCVKAGDTVPPVLPPDLIPPSYRRKRSLSGVTAIPTVAPAMAPTVENIAEEKQFVATFEDKRRENFEKGQVELDRRRQALLDAQKREREERERKEREEFQKREQIRLEQERRRLEEHERQVQRQREIESEKEEQRRKQLEQREAARREMERQRMLEWETTRKQDLMNQKIKTQEEILKLKSKKKSLGIETERVTNKLNELNNTVSETGKKVYNIKAEIDSMRLERDQKLGLLSSIKAQIKALSDRQLYIEQEKLKLTQQLKSTAAAAGAANESTDQFALQNKQININQLKSQIEVFEKERTTKMSDLDNNNIQLNELKEKLNEIIEKTNQLANVYESKRIEAQELRDIHSQQISQDVNASWGQAVPSNVEWPTDNNSYKIDSNVSKVKYRCLYAFHSRNKDELTVEPGDIVLVNTSACSEPGWLSGESNGQIGWFPEAYVEPLDGQLEESMDQNKYDIQKPSQLEGIDEAPEIIPDSEIITESVSQFISSDKSSFDRTSSTTKTSETMATTIKAIAQYPWKAKEDNHLSFSKGDIIAIKEQQDMWWFGQVGSTSGWFPKSYVKTMDEKGNIAQEDEYYISLYPFESQESGDLTFDSNELIKVIKKEGDWWTGSIGQLRQGVFPSNYVRIAQPEEMPNPVLTEPNTPAPKTTCAPPPHSQMTAPTPPPASEGERRNSESCDSPKPSKKSKLKKLEIVAVIAPYKATGPEQLSLEKQQLVQVRKKTSSGWWEGEIQVKGKKKQVGWFPASYVKALNTSGGSGGSSARSTPDPIHQKVSEDKESEKVIALYSFGAQHDDELSFEANDLIKVLAKEDTTWWKGQLVSTGAIGLFPSNHVEVYREQYQDIDEQNIDCNYDEFGYGDNEEIYEEINEFDDEEEERDPTESVISYSITDDERKRQNHINEFIATEKAYLRDMEVVVDVFQNPLKDSNCITDAESEAIFVNWPKLVKCNQKFLKALRNRKRNAIISNNVKIINEISDLFCHHLDLMSEHYVKYCSRQLTAARLIQNKTENDSNFNKMAKTCSQDTRSNRLPLSSYLLKPMQRITKYPLLIGKILEHTPNNHSDYGECGRALKLSQDLCKRVNEACRTTEDSQRLQWIQKHIRIDSIDQNIVFDSETNCLGRRQLLHSGTLIKANSGRELVAFLLNDFLLLTIPSKEMPKITNVFASDKALSSTYRIYKEPILLNDIIITELPQFESNLDPNLFQMYINSQQKYLTFKAISSNERSLWVKSIDISSRHFKDIERLDTSSSKTSISEVNKLRKRGRLFVTVIEGLQLMSTNNVLNAYCELSITTTHDNVYQSYTTKVVRCVPASPTGDRTLISRSSPSIVTKTQSNICRNNLFKVKWNHSNQLIIYEDMNNLLQIKCYDRNPFAPHYLIGSSVLSVNELAEEMSQIQGPITKEVQLSVGDIKNSCPKVYLKLDLQYFDK